MNVDSVFSIPEDADADLGYVDSLDKSGSHRHLNTVGLNREMFDEVTIVRSFETALECEIAFTHSDFDRLLTELFDVLLAVVVAQIHRPDIVIAGFDGLDERVGALADKVVDAAVKCLEVIDSC